MNAKYPIEVRHLTKSYGSLKAIDRVSFHVNQGEVVGFLGPNGAGKSTTMRILCGIMPATSGAAYVCGMPVASYPQDIKRKIGYMPENNPLPEDMRVSEYLYHRARLKEIPSRQRKARVEHAMEMCDLHHKAHRKIIGTLSKGFRQRVGIADAILAEPDVIIMDEPTIGLDPHQVISIRELIQSLRKRMTVVLSSHILSEIELCCDRIIIINHGHIVAQGSVPDLRKEFVPQVSYKLIIKAESSAVIDSLCDIDSSLSITACGDTQADGFQEVLLETTKTRDLGEDIVAAIVKAGVKLREVVRQEPQLEDLFLAATKRSWKQTLPSSSKEDPLADSSQGTTQ